MCPRPGTPPGPRCLIDRACRPGDRRRSLPTSTQPGSMQAGPTPTVSTPGALHAHARAPPGRRRFGDEPESSPEDPWAPDPDQLEAHSPSMARRLVRPPEGGDVPPRVEADPPHLDPEGTDEDSRLYSQANSTRQV